MKLSELLSFLMLAVAAPAGASEGRAIVCQPSEQRYSVTFRQHGDRGPETSRRMSLCAPVGSGKTRDGQAFMEKEVGKAINGSVILISADPF